MLPNPKYFVCDSLYCFVRCVQKLSQDTICLQVVWNISVPSILENNITESSVSVKDFLI
jgi:hypothetical protein